MSTHTIAITVSAIAVDRDAAAALFGICTRTFESRVRDGTLPKPRKIKGCARWLVSELAEAAEQLPESDLLPPPAGRSED